MKFYTNFALNRNQIFVRGYDDGQPFFEQLAYKPTLFLPSNEETGYKTLRGNHIKQIDFPSPREAKDFIKQYQDVQGFNVYGLPMFEYNAIAEWYPGQIQYDPSVVRTFNFDIEVYVDPEIGGFPEPAVAEWPINSIAVIYKDRCICFGVGDFDVNKLTQEYQMPIIFQKCDDEKMLLEKLINFWCLVNPDILTGWNIESFDIPYLFNRIIKTLGESHIKRLSPIGRVKARTFNGSYGREEVSYSIGGIAILDYIQLYRKHTFVTRESYSLDHISQVELGEEKLKYEGNLFTLYEDDPQLFFEYNCKDVFLVHRLNEKLGLIELVMNMSYFAKINYEDTSSPVKTWDVVIANRLLEQYNIAVETHSKRSERGSYEGAYVREPVPGLYGHVISVDLNSMYPKNIESLNIGPDTYIPDEELAPELLELREKVRAAGVDGMALQKVDTGILKEYDVAMATNGEFYSRKNEGIFSILVKELYSGRKADKSDELKANAQIEQINQILHERGMEA